MLWIGIKPLKTWRVKSKSSVHPDTGEPITYTLELWADKKLLCSCAGCKWSKKGKLCYHAREKLKSLKKQFGSLDEAIKYYGIQLSKTKS